MICVGVYMLVCVASEGLGRSATKAALARAASSLCAKDVILGVRRRGARVGTRFFSPVARWLAVAVQDETGETRRDALVSPRDVASRSRRAGRVSRRDAAARRDSRFLDFAEVVYYKLYTLQHTPLR